MKELFPITFIFLLIVVAIIIIIILADACECGNEPSGSVKCGEFLDWLQTG